MGCDASGSWRGLNCNERLVPFAAVGVDILVAVVDSPFAAVGVDNLADLRTALVAVVEEGIPLVAEVGILAVVVDTVVAVDTVAVVDIPSAIVEGNLVAVVDTILEDILADPLVAVEDILAAEVGILAIVEDIHPFAAVVDSLVVA